MVALGGDPTADRRWREEGAEGERAGLMSWLDAPACVYVMGHRCGPQKVGYTGDLKLRLQHIRRDTRDAALPIFAHFEIATRWALHAERMAHWFLRDHAIRKEWFDVSPETAAAAVERAVSLAYEGMDLIPPVVPTGGAAYPEHATGRFKKGTFARMEAVSGSRDRAQFIREAVERELERREGVDNSVDN
jgi:hypothetical protein